MSTTATPAASMSRSPSSYTPSNTVLQTINENPIPGEMIRKCVEEGGVEEEGDFDVKLRYEELAHSIELRIDLVDKVIKTLDSSYEVDDPAVK